MLIRTMMPDADLPALQALWRATWRDAYGPVLGPERLHLIEGAVAQPDVQKMFAADGGGLVAADRGSVVGSVCFAERHGCGYVWGMYVHPAHQRRGIGAALLTGAACAMDGAAAIELSTTSPASEGFYRRLGFAAVGASEFELFPGVIRPSTRFNADAAALRSGGSVSPPA